MPAPLSTLDHDPGIVGLRRLDRVLSAHLDRLDARVDTLLAAPGAPTDRDVADVDLLCAAIAEATELLEEARDEADAQMLARRERRERPRRWA
jgi:hypothetical protein